MNEIKPRLAVVTASLDFPRAESCIYSWERQSSQPFGRYVVLSGQPQVARTGWQRIPFFREEPRWIHLSREILGVVPAFAIGVQRALEDGAEIIACLHDDVLIEEEGWDKRVLELFDQHPACGLAGFGGALGLADGDIYQKSYNPMQLARQTFLSNMRDAEAHGGRCLQTLRISVLDGFSQIGRREFWESRDSRSDFQMNPTLKFPVGGVRPMNLFEEMQEWGIVHHAYDAALGCFAKRLGWETYLIPVRVHHHGGLTAVADPRYHEWANQYAQQTDKLEGIVEEGIGDQVFWQRSHRIVYDQFRDVLPLRLT